MDLISYKLSKNYTDELNNLKIKNSIINGDFSSGDDGWSFGSNTVINNDYLTYVSSQSGNVYQHETKVSHGVFYFTVKVRGDGHIGFNIGTSFEFYRLNLNTPSWERHSVVTTNESPGYFYFGRKSVRGTVDFDNFFLCNLSNVFGAGNEPTKEEMDALIDIVGWFDGEVTLTQKQELTWLLGMIRQNREAITALGGTIT
mgnify:CR=1 FL=1